MKNCNCGSLCLCNIESKPIMETDSMGREEFWLDAGRPE